ncbi:MAG: DUF3592 domain-containing protein [Pseudomonadota bacterium]
MLSMENTGSGVSVAFIICCAIGVLALLAGLYLAGKTVAFRLGAAQVEATLVESVKTECQDMSRSNSTGAQEATYYTCYQPIVEYEFGEYVYTTDLVDRQPEPYAPGTTFRLLVDAKAPDQVMMQDRYWVFSLLLAVFGLFFIGGAFVFRA